MSATDRTKNIGLSQYKVTDSMSTIGDYNRDMNTIDGAVKELRDKNLELVPKTRKINGKDLSKDINLTPEDIGTNPIGEFRYLGQGDRNSYAYIGTVQQGGYGYATCSANIKVIESYDYGSGVATEFLVSENGQYCEINTGFINPIGYKTRLFIHKEPLDGIIQTYSLYLKFDNYVDNARVYSFRQKTYAFKKMTSAEYSAETAGKELIAQQGSIGRIAINGASVATYPIGSIYQSTINTNPNGIVGGSWTALTSDGEIFRWKRTA